MAETALDVIELVAQEEGRVGELLSFHHWYTGGVATFTNRLSETLTVVCVVGAK